MGDVVRQLTTASAKAKAKAKVASKAKVPAKAKAKAKAKANAKTPAKAGASAKSGTETKSRASAKATGAERRTAKARSAAASTGSAAGNVTALQSRLRKARADLLADRESDDDYVSISRVLGLGAGSAARLPAAVASGLPVAALDKLADGLAISVRELSEDLIGISRQTLSRRRQAGLLTASESDAVVRYARLLEQACALLEGDKAAALRWMKSALPVLGGETPLAHARTEAGGREVEFLIGRIEHGVYS